LLDLIASFLVRGLNKFLHFMPIRFDLWLGRCFGRLVYCLSGKRKRITYSNLKAAFSGEKTPRQIKRITKNVYRNAAQTFAEILSMTKFDKKYIYKYVDVIDEERIEKASKNPKGMILVSAHFGNWELSTVTSVMHGYPLYLLARDQKMVRLNELLNLLRETKGNTVIRKGMDIKNIFRVLHEGKSLGILADQNAGMNGELIDFFGRPASTATGPYRFAQKSGAWILPAFIHREKGPYHKLILEEPLMIGRDDDIIPYMQKYNNLLEKHVRNYPDQWLWMHKRWKVTPLKKILVLDDGKKGHLKQSLSVVKQIKRYRSDEGFDPDHLKVELVSIKFKSKFTRTLFGMLSVFFGPYLQGRTYLLKWAFEDESYKKAVNTYADIIVSCGSALFAVNKMLKIENWARNVTVLDPGKFNRKKFDLVVIPRHDYKESLSGGNNFVVTELAPNLIDTSGLDDLKKTTEERKALEGKLCIGLLVGGDNPYFTFSETLSERIARSVRKASELFDGKVLVTTSRRTPQRAEGILKDALKTCPGCVKFISGKGDTDEKTVDKILALSDIVIVSGESISMVSEAVSSGKQVLVFMPDKKTDVLTKYEKFIQDLSKKNYLKLIEPESIPGEIKDLTEKRTGSVSPDDNERIYKKLYKLF